MPALASLPALTLPELNELGLALTHRGAMLNELVQTAADEAGRADARERLAVCGSLATAVAEALMHLR